MCSCSRPLLQRQEGCQRCVHNCDCVISHPQQHSCAAPPSLVNVYKELANDVSGFRIPNHGYLQSWATQGVLLLNAVLTVREKEPNSHASQVRSVPLDRCAASTSSQGWETFTDAIINYLNTHESGIVFMLWGAYAQKKGKGIDQVCPIGPSEASCPIAVAAEEAPGSQWGAPVAAGGQQVPGLQALLTGQHLPRRQGQAHHQLGHPRG